MANDPNLNNNTEPVVNQNTNPVLPDSEWARQHKEGTLKGQTFTSSTPEARTTGSELTFSDITNQQQYDQILQELKQEGIKEDYDTWYEGLGKTTLLIADSAGATLAQALSVLIDPGEWKLPTIGGSVDFLTGLAGYQTNVEQTTNVIDPLAGFNRVTKAVEGYSPTSPIGDWIRDESRKSSEYNQYYNQVNTASSWYNTAANNLAPAIGSMAGFFIPGAAVAKVGQLAKLGQTTNTLLNAFLMTETTGVMIAEDTYDKVYEEVMHKLSPNLKTLEDNAYNDTYNKVLKEGGNEKDAVWQGLQAIKNTREEFGKLNPELHKTASENAQKGADATVKSMLPSFALNLISANLFTRSLYSPKNILSKPSLFTIEGLKEGGSEFAEEGILEPIAQDIGVAYGTKGTYNSQDLSKVIWDSEKKDWNWDNLYAGGIGFLMGGATSAIRDVTDFKERKEQYEKQQKQLQKENRIGESAGIPERISKATSLMNTLDEVMVMGKEAARLEREGNKEEANAIKSKILAVQAYEAFSSGTTKNLVENYEKIANDPNTPADAKLRAREAIVEIEQLGEVYQKTKSKFINSDQVFSNRVNDLNLTRAETQLQNEILQKRIEADKSVQSALKLGDTTLKTLARKEDVLDEQGNVVGQKDISEKELSYDLTKLDENPYTDTNERDVYDLFRSHITENVQSVRELVDLENRLKKIQNFKNQNEKSYNKITSKQYQESVKNEQKLAQAFKAKQKELEELKGTEKYMPLVDNLMQKYKGKIDDKDFNDIRRSFQFEHEKKVAAQEIAKQEAIREKYSDNTKEPEVTNNDIISQDGKSPTSEPVAEETAIDDIARKFANGATLKDLSKEEQTFAFNNSAQIEKRVNEIQNNAPSEQQIETEEVNTELNEVGNEVVNLLSEISGVNPNPVKPLSNAKVDNIIEGDKELQEKKDDIEKRRQEEILNRKGNTISQSEVERRFIEKRSSDKTQEKLTEGLNHTNGNVNPEKRWIDKDDAIFQELVDLGVKPDSRGVIDNTAINKAFSENESRLKKEVNEEIKQEGLKRVTDEFRKQDDKQKFEEINAKYDAELAALEGTTQQESTLTVQEQTALSKIKGDQIQKFTFHRQLGDNFQSIVDSLIAKGAIKLEGNNYVKLTPTITITVDKRSEAEIAADKFINSEFTFTGNDYQLIVKQSKDEEKNKKIKDAIDVIKDKIKNNTLSGWRIEEAKVFNDNVYKIYKPVTNGVSAEVDEVSYQPNELNENIPAEKLEKLKELVSDYAEIMESENDRFPTFEEMMKSFIKNVGRKQAEAYIKSLGKGWELNGYGKISNYDALVTKLFKDPKLVANELVNISSQITSEVEISTPEESSINLSAQITTETEEATKVPVAVTPDNQTVYESNSNLSEDSRNKFGHSFSEANIKYTVEDGTVYTEYEEVPTELKNTGLVKSAKLIDYDNYQAGTELEIVVPDLNELVNLVIPVRNEDPNSLLFGAVETDENGKRKTIMFGDWVNQKTAEYQERGEDFMNSQEYWDRIPMFIRDADGDNVAYVREPQWYNPTSFSGDIQQAQTNARETRKAARDAKNNGKTFPIVITENTGGLFKPLEVNYPIKVSTANPDSQIAYLRKDNNGNRDLFIDNKRVTLNVVNLAEIIKQIESDPKSKNLYAIDVRRWGTDKEGNPTYRAFYTISPTLNEMQVETVTNLVLSNLILRNKNIPETSKGAFLSLQNQIKSIADTNGATIDIGSFQVETLLSNYIIFNHRPGLLSKAAQDNISANIKNNEYGSPERTYAAAYNANLKAGTPYIFYQQGYLVYGIAGQKANILSSEMMNVVDSTANLSPEVKEKVAYLKQVLDKCQLSLSNKWTGPVIHVNSNLGVNTVANTYHDYLADNLTTKLKSINIGNENNPKYVTRVQPSIFFEPKGAISRKQNQEYVSDNKVTEEDKQKMSNVLESTSDERLEQVVEELVQDGIEIFGNTPEQKVEDLKQVIQEMNNESKEIVEDYLEAEPEIDNIVEFNEFLKQSENQIKWVNEYFKNDYTEDVSSQPREVEESDVKEMNINLMRIDGISSRHQTQLANYVDLKLGELLSAEKINQQEIKNKIEEELSQLLNTNKKILEDTLAKIKAIPNGDKIQKVVNLINKYETAIDKINLVMNNTDIIYEQGLAIALRDLNGKITDNKIETKDVSKDNDTDLQEDENEESEFPEEEGAYLGTENYSKTSLEVNPKSSVTSVLRRFLKDIPDVNPKTGLPKTGVMGTPLHIDFDTAFDTLLSILADAPVDYTKMIEILKLNQDKQPWIPAFIEKLENSNNEIKMQFTSTMGKHALTMEFMMYSFSSNGVTLKVMNTNSFSIGSKVIRDWKNNLVSNSPLVNEYGEIQLDVANELYEDYKSWADFPVDIASDYSKYLTPLVRQKKSLIAATNNNEKLRNALKTKDRRLVVDGRQYRVSLNPNGDITITPLTKNVVNSAIVNYNNLTLEEQKEALEKVSNWLNAFGIEMTDNAIESIFKNGIYHQGKLVTPRVFFQESAKTGGAIGLLADYLNKVTSTPLAEDEYLSIYDDENNPLLQSAIEKTLAVHQSRFSSGIVTSGFRDGKKSIYGFTATKYITDRSQELKTNENLRNQLRSLSFSKNSLWLQFFEDGVDLPNWSFGDTFNISHLSLNAIKEYKKQIYRDNGITALGDIDHEMVKIGMHQDTKQGVYKTPLVAHNETISLRTSRFLFPTMADKSTMTLIKTMSLKLNEKRFYNLSETNKLVPNENISNLLFEQLVLPELERILNFTKNVEKTDIKNYDKGAQMFLFLPKLNDLVIGEKDGIQYTLRDALLNKDTTLNKILTDKDLIIKELQNYVVSLVDEKLKVWENNGYYVVNDKGEATNKLLDTAYMSQIDGDTQKQNIELAALDFEINQLISNANAFMTMIGDPAIYYKVDESQRTKNFTEKSQETFVNVGKRLAAMIAPGTKLANSQDEKYTQIFLKDRIALSENIEFLTLLLDNKKFDWNKYNEIKNRVSPSDDPATLKEFELQREADMKTFYEAYPNSNGYFDIEGTDAQEYTTWQEHMHILENLGRLNDATVGITPEEIRIAKEMFANGTPIDQMSEAQKGILKKVLQPIKPVYTGQIYDGKQDVMRMMYIKSSSFPLLPQLTQGLELNKLREALEDLQKEEGSYKYVRASYQTANKVGAKARGLDIYNGDGSVKDISRDDLKTEAVILNRKDFRIQLDVPFKSLKRDEDRISLGTQLTKLLFGNGIMELSGFMLDGESKTGAQLEEEFTKSFIDLANLKKEQLYDELGIDIKTGEPKDVYKTAVKLQNILKTEAVNRGYSRQDIESLELEIKNVNGKDDINFKMPVWLSSNSNRFESLLNAIVNNRLVRMKFSGNSYIAGSEEGFKVQTDFKGIDKNKVVWTSKWNNQSLQAAKYDANGKLQYAQVLAPSKFRKQDGTLIDLLEQKNSQYVYVTETETGFKLKEDMIDPELRNISSFRIPTSGHNSASQIEIVGFLPQETGDLMIVPKNLTKQKGLDFDVDKENTYQLWHQVDENGKITVLKDGDNEKMLQNKIIKIHSAVLSNPSKDVQKKINGILSIEYAKDQAELIDGWVNTVKDDVYFTPLSSEYQKSKMFLGASGKVGTGAYSLDVTSQSLFEQARVKGTQLYIRAGENQKYIVRFGKDEKPCTGNLGESKTLDKDRTIAEVLAELQNIAVDNEKEQVMGRVNLNSYTLDVSKALAMLGFDKSEVTGNSIQFMFLSQPILIDYVKEMANANSNVSSFTVDKESRVIRDLLIKYGDSTYELGYKKDVDNNDILSMSAMEEQLKTREPNNNLQLAVLNRFLELKKIGEQIRTVQTSINLDSKGLSKSIPENIEKINSIIKLKNNPVIANADKLLGDIVLAEDLSITEKENLVNKGYIPFGNAFILPTTINGIFTANALSTADALWSKHFPYSSQVISTISNEILPLISKSEASDAKKAEKRNLIIKEIKKYLNSLVAAKTLFENKDSQAERERLFFDRVNTGKVSLASYIKELIKSNSSLKSNALFQKLDFKINKDGKPSTIKFNNTASGSYDEDALNNAILELMELNINLPSFNDEPYTSRLLAQDLVSYAMLEGGVQEATQFAKFIPIKYLEKMGFTFDMSEIDFNSSEAINDFGIDLDNPKNMSIFTTQFAQHNPNLLPKLDNLVNDIEYLENIADLESFTMKDLITEIVIKRSQGEKAILENIESEYKSTQQPDFISYRDKNQDGKYHLWQKMGDTYYKIPIAGASGMSEYNNTLQPVKSLITKDIDQNPLTVEPIMPELTDDGRLVKEQRFGLGGQDSIVDIITKIANNKTIDPYLINLAQQLLPHVDSSTTITVAPIQDKGTYNRTQNAITISLDQAQAASDTELARTILKELVHSITDNEISKYVYFSEGQYNLKTNNAPEHIQALIRLFNQVSNSPEFANALRAIREKRGSKDKKPLTKEEARVYYGGIDVYEFIEMMMTQPEFQQKMAQTKVANGNSVLKLFRDFVSKLFNHLGITFESDTVAAQAIENIFILIDEKGKVKKEPVVEIKAEPIVETNLNEISTDVKSDLLGLLEEIQSDINNDLEVEYADVNLGEFRGYPNVQEYFNNPYGVEMREYNYIKNNKDVVEELLKTVPKKDAVSLIKKLKSEIDTKKLTISADVTPILTVDTSIEEKLISQVEALPEMKKYELFPGVFANAQQTEALDKLDTFISSPRSTSEKRQSTFVLIGRAGTGKTTIVKKILDLHPNKKVVGAAVSNSAKNLLNSSLGKGDVVTIASLIGYKENRTTGKYELDKNFDLSKSPISKAQVLIIDESSMVSKEMINAIYQLAPASCKIIFMGDNAQLPPIGETNDSQTFNAATKPENNAKLTERMRQGEDSPIVALSDILAANIEKPVNEIDRRVIRRRESTFNPITNKGVLFANRDQLFSELKKDLLADPQNTKVIAYTNDARARMNNIARQMLWGEVGAQNEYNVGEILVANDLKYPRNIINGEYYKVSSVIPASAAISIEVVEVENNQFRVVEKKFPGYKITAEVISDGENFGKTVTFTLPTKEAKAVIDNVQQSYVDSKNWGIFYRNKDVLFDIDYGYAITAHKSQGSTFNNAYVMEDNIIESGMSNKEVNQALNVAITRPRNKTVIYSKLNSTEKTSQAEEMTGMEETGQSFQPREEYVSSEANIKQYLRDKGVIDKYLNILDLGKFRTLHNQLKQEIKNYIKDFDGKLFIESDNGTKAYPNKAVFQQIDAYDGIKYELEKAPLPGKKVTPIKLPQFNIDTQLQNKDGSKRFASTSKDGVITVNPVTSVDEFFDYFEGKEGGITSQQKALVLAELANQNWPIEKIKALLRTPDAVNTFLVLHENSHVENKDQDVYWTMGRDLLTADKIAIETRATIDALVAMENALPNKLDYRPESTVRKQIKETQKDVVSSAIENQIDELIRKGIIKSKCD
jgi:hypothetical protein